MKGTLNTLLLEKNVIKLGFDIAVFPRHLANNCCMKIQLLRTVIQRPWLDPKLFFLVLLCIIYSTHPILLLGVGEGWRKVPPSSNALFFPTCAVHSWDRWGTCSPHLCAFHCTLQGLINTLRSILFPFLNSTFLSQRFLSWDLQGVIQG